MSIIFLKTRLTLHNRLKKMLLVFLAGCVISSHLEAQHRGADPLVNSDFSKHPEQGLHKPLRNDFQQAEELVELRTKHTKTFKNIDGTTTLAYSSEELHYVDAQGWLRTISRQLRHDMSDDKIILQAEQKFPKSFDSRTNQLGVSISPNGSMIYFGDQIKVRQYGADKSLLSQSGMNNDRSIMAELAEGSVYVKNVVDSIDYAIDLGNFYFKNNFVLKSKALLHPAADEVWFSDIFKLPLGYQLIADDSSIEGVITSFIITDKNREPVLRFLPPVIAQSGSFREDGIWTSNFRIKPLGNNQYEVSIVVDASWLLDESRVYPIIIDPLAIFENNQQMPSCFFPDYQQSTSSIPVPEGNVIFNTFLSWDFVAVNGTQAWTSDQRSFVSGPAGETPVQIGIGNASGMQTYALNSFLASVVSSGQIDLTWHASRTWGGSGCNANFNFISRRYVEITYGDFEFGEGQVMINEYSCSNRQLADDFGNFEDWIELYNPSPLAVDLTGYYLSDNPNNPMKWQFPGGFIPPMGHLVVICSGRDAMSGSTPHTNFRLSQLRPEFILFSNPAGVLLESYQLVTTQNGHSRGRLSSGSEEWGFFTSPSPGAPNTNGRRFYTPKPEMSISAGFYEQSITVEITSAQPGFEIRYTTNGAMPTATSTLYTGPINVSQTQVIRARCFTTDTDYLPGFFETNTYFINEQFSLPVFSFSGEQLNTLFNGSQIRPIGAFEFFDANGQFVDESVGDFNKHGNDSWSYPQRGVDFICRDEYGYNEALKYKFFSTSHRDNFQRLMVKAAANDNYPFQNGGAHIRDAYIQSLSQLSKLDLDERSSSFVIVYVNGAYWGVYDLRERVDDNDFTEFYYGQERKFRGSDEYIQFLKTWGSTQAEYGNQRAINDWNALINFINQNDMSIPSNYAQVRNWLNVESLIDYIVMNSFVVSRDWLNYNTGWWRGLNTSAQATTWRYILWDMDAAFGHFINYTGMPDVSATAPPCQVDNLNVGNGHIQSLKKLIDQNAEVRTMYINRYNDLLNTHFSCSNLLHVLDSMVAVIAPEIPRQIQRWGGNMQTWQNNVQSLRNFINTRCNALSGLLANCYNLSGPQNITFVVEPEGKGEIKLNSEWLSNYPFVASVFGNINTRLEARGVGLYEFSHWEFQYADTSFSGELNPFISEFTQSATIKAVFVNPFEFETDKELLYYWHFNDFNPTADVKEIEADYKLLENTNPLMSYTGTGARDIDDFSPGTMINIQLEEEAGKAARVRNPSTSRSLIFNLPTNGYGDLLFRYAVQRSNQGMLRNIISYSTDGSIYSQEGLVQHTFDIQTDYTLVEVDFSQIASVNNNPLFHIRINFNGNTTQDNGNNRFDNITLFGKPSTVSVHNPEQALVKVFPNPSKGIFTVNEAIPGSFYTIYDISGRLVQQGRFTSGSQELVDISKFEDGLYMLKIFSANSLQTIKLIKQ